MKTITCKVSALDRIPYPNAATREEMLHKVLNTLICGVVGAGLAACSLLLLAIL